MHSRNGGHNHRYGSPINRLRGELNYNNNNKGVGGAKGVVGLVGVKGEGGNQRYT